MAAWGVPLLEGVVIINRSAKANVHWRQSNNHAMKYTCILPPFTGRSACKALFVPRSQMR